VRRPVWFVSTFCSLFLKFSHRFIDDRSLQVIHFWTKIPLSFLSSIPSLFLSSRTRTLEATKSCPNVHGFTCCLFFNGALRLAHFSGLTSSYFCSVVVCDRSRGNEASYVSRRLRLITRDLFIEFSNYI